MNNATVTIHGNLTADPELLVLASGAQKLTFSVAVGYYFTKDDEKVEQTSFFDVVAWRWVAENSANVLQKGIGVIVIGRLEQQTWDDKETGAKRSKVILNADEIGVLTRSIASLERKVNNKSGASSPAASSVMAKARTKPSAPQKQLVPEGEAF